MAGTTPPNSASGIPEQEIVTAIQGVKIPTANDLADALKPLFEGIGRTKPIETKAQLQQSALSETGEVPFWIAIKNRTKAISFDQHYGFINRVLCGNAIPPAPPVSGDPVDPCDVPKEDGAKNKKLTQRNMQEDRLAREVENVLSFHGSQAYEFLRTATEVFLLLECGVAIRLPMDQETAGLPSDGWETNVEDIPKSFQPRTFKQTMTALEDYLGKDYSKNYIATVLKRAFGIKPEEAKSVSGVPFCPNALVWNPSPCQWPCMIELIWSYWMEEGMLIQTMNAISRRFQNVRGKRYDPLADLELDPLRPLNNFLWGFIQDENHRLSLMRRVYEYDHHYGFRLYGKAVPPLNPADSRPKFIEAFHDLLYRATLFYREDADTTVLSDGFPLLNALKELHLLLAQGAHNQFRDLPWTARVEMLMMQWMLAREEMRDFLRHRPMVPYKETWMGRVDAMKKLQGWSDVSIMHYAELANCGEKLLLSVRYGNWSVFDDQEIARTWARFWKPEVQTYIHAYRTVTGVDLTMEPTDPKYLAARNTIPSVHLRNRLALQSGARTR